LVLVQVLGEVLRSLAEDTAVEVGSCDAVLDVFSGDLGAVLVLQTLLDLHRPLGEVVVGFGEVGGHVGDQVRGVLPRFGVEGQEGTCVVPAEVPVERVVGVGRVGGVEVRGQGVAQGTASAVGGVDHLVLTAVEVFGVGRVAACSSPATG